MTATNVDVDQYPLTRNDVNDQTVPTTVALKNGEELLRLVSAKTAAELDEAFAAYL